MVLSCESRFQQEKALLRGQVTVLGCNSRTALTGQGKVMIHPCSQFGNEDPGDTVPEGPDM